MMAEHSVIGATSRDRFMQAAQNEMAKFERREIEFRKKDRVADSDRQGRNQHTALAHWMELSRATPFVSAAPALRAR
jgi:hypothetical protein